MFFRWNTSTGSIQDSSYVPVSSLGNCGTAVTGGRISHRTRETRVLTTASLVVFSSFS